MQDIVKQIVDMDRKAREITAAVEQDRLNSEKEIAQKRVELRAEYLAKAREAIPSSESQERAAAEKEWEIVAKKHADLSRELDELYSKKGDEWVNNIVAQVIACLPVFLPMLFQQKREVCTVNV